MIRWTLKLERPDRFYLGFCKTGVAAFGESVLITGNTNLREDVAAAIRYLRLCMKETKKTRNSKDTRT